MKASIIISDVISQDMLLTCVAALCNQTVPSNQYEVIFPDCGTITKEEKAVIESFEQQYPHFHVLRAPGKNRSAIINIAARQARGELLLFTESHCIAYRDWVRDYLKLFQEKKIPVAMGQFRTIPTDSWVGQAEEHQFKRVRKHLAMHGLDIFFFDFHNTAITKKCFFSMGGLAEDIPIMSEFELGANLHQNNIPIYRSESIVWHMNDSKLEAYARIVRAQAKDKSVMLRRRGKHFMNTYFPNSYYRILPLIKMFRIPYYFAVSFLRIIAKIGFLMTRFLRFQRASNYFFRSFAEYSHHQGMLQGLKP